MKRVLLLASTTSYRTDDFARAAAKLGVEAVLGTNRCHELAGLWPTESFGSVEVQFRDEQRAAAQIVALARDKPFDAIIPTDDPTAEIAARAAQPLGLRGNSVAAAMTARNKLKMREALRAAGVPCPDFLVFDEGSDPQAIAEGDRQAIAEGSDRQAIAEGSDRQAIAEGSDRQAIAEGSDRQAAEISFPCVIKPLLCSASRGVIRASTRAAFVSAWKRLHAILQTPALRAVEDPDGHRILVERFIPGPEVAVEGLLSRGKLQVLAIFDKPDPLDGPFFEETIYVTPSRHSPAMQEQIAAVTERAAAAMGLREGPVHAELRISQAEPHLNVPVVIEVAARSIGGLCSRTLRFGLGEVSLEELVIRHALGEPIGEVERRGAAGVMMLPIERGGVLQAVEGTDEAKAVPLVEDVQVTAKIGQVLEPLPEGASYLGFVFARGEKPEEVEAALREAHARLRFTVAAKLN